MRQRVDRVLIEQARRIGGGTNGAERGMLHLIPVIEGEAVQSESIERHCPAFRLRGARNLRSFAEFKQCGGARKQVCGAAWRSNPSPRCAAQIVCTAAGNSSKFCLRAGKTKCFHRPKNSQKVKFVPLSGRQREHDLPQMPHRSAYSPVCSSEPCRRALSTSLRNAITAAAMSKTLSARAWSMRSARNTWSMRSARMPSNT